MWLAETRWRDGRPVLIGFLVAIGHLSGTVRVIQCSWSQAWRHAFEWVSIVYINAHDIIINFDDMIPRVRFSLTQTLQGIPIYRSEDLPTNTYPWVTVWFRNASPQQAKQQPSINPFTPEWSMSNFSCSLTRNMTSHSKENLAFHSLLRWKMILIQILTTLLMLFPFRRLGECTFWAQEWKGWLWQVKTAHSHC